MIPGKEEPTQRFLMKLRVWHRVSNVLNRPLSYRVFSAEEEAAMVMNQTEETEGTLRITFYDMKPDAFPWKTEYYLQQSDQWIEVSKISATRVALENFIAVD